MHELFKPNLTPKEIIQIWKKNKKKLACFKYFSYVSTVIEKQS